MSDWDDFINSADQALPASTSTAPKKTYPCGQCAGTGHYQGVLVHQGKTHCFACRGKGYFTKSPDQRAASKARREKRKMNAQDRIRELLLEFAKDHPDMYRELLEVKTTGIGNDYKQNMAARLWRDGALSEHSILGWYKGKDLAAQRAAERAAERKAQSVKVDLEPIRRIFETASASGHKKPTYRAEGLILSLAPSTGRNPGAIYVKSAGSKEYLGKLIGTEFSPSREGIEAKAGQSLSTIAEDPLAAAVNYGRKTGTCACCGRGLTDKTSVEMGIGPICAGRWGLI